ncbi:MAG: LysR family transcriptional regulator, partial [Hyphomonadaceae bacterium]
MPRPLQSVDLNLLVALKTLLEEENVTQAARRHGRSAPAMSRILSRLRETLDDPLLVRAGGRMAPTPRAKSLLPAVTKLLGDAQAIIQPHAFDPRTLERQFTIQANEDLAAGFSTPIMKALNAASANVTVRFALETPESEGDLRGGRIDLRIGSGAPAFAEMISQRLFRQRLIGAARKDHPLFRAPITAPAFASVDHIARSRKGEASDAIDDALAALSLKRRVRLIVPSARIAVTVAAETDLVATGPAVLV